MLFKLLAAVCLGLTIALFKQGHHAVAVIQFITFIVSLSIKPDDQQ